MEYLYVSIVTLSLLSCMESVPYFYYKGLEREETLSIRHVEGLMKKNPSLRKRH